MADDAYVEAVLQELIQRFSHGARDADARQALLEAKRMRSTLQHWITVAPSADARAAFMSRLSALLAAAEANAPPGAPGITPPRGLSRVRPTKSSSARIEGLSRAVTTTSLASAKARASSKPPAGKRTQQFPAPVSWQGHPGAPGVELMLLERDAVRGTCSALVRVKPGQTLPGDRGDGKLNVMLLAGAAQLGSKQMAVGDARRIGGEPPGASLVAGAGCTLAVVGPAEDPLFQPPGGAKGPARGK